MRVCLVKLGEWNEEGLRIEEATGEPRQGCSWFTEKSEERNLEDRFRVFAAHCSLVASPMGVPRRDFFVHA